MPGGIRTGYPLGVRLERWIDGAADGLVAAFALWTIGYEIALAGRASVWGLAVVWIPISLLCAVVGALSYADSRPHAVEPAGRLRAPTPWPHRLTFVVLMVLLSAAVLLRSHVGVLLPILLAVAVVGQGLLSGRRSPSRDVQLEGEHDEAGRTFAALALCAGAAVFASFLRREDADDVFYVNRATWVAEHGVPPLRDTMFGPETYPSTYGGGLPFPSVEALFGALAHLLELRAGTLAYVVAVPPLAFAAVWATWRLVRAWTPSRAVPVLLATTFVILLNGHSVAGSYSVGRIWQGKVIAFVILSPLVWTYFTALVTSDRRGVRRALVLLLLSGVAFAGLTSGAPLLAPTFAAAAGLGALILRSRQLILGALLFLVGPVVAGLSVVLGPQGVAEGGASGPLSSVLMFNTLFGTSTALVVLGVLAISLAVRLLRPEAAVLASCASLVALVAMVPGVADLAHSLTGAGPIAWRLTLVVPVSVLIGVLLAVGIPALVTSTTWRTVIGATAVVGLVVAGQPLWVGEHAALAPGPGWKVEPVALSDLEDVLELPAGAGMLLLPEQHSQVLAIYTTSRFAVVPRAFYLGSLDDTPSRRKARAALFRWVNQDSRLVPRSIRKKLDLLDVAVVCVPRDDPGLVGQLDHVAGESGSPVRGVGTLSCAVRAGSAWSPDSTA